jgi:hypothetical protein
VGFVTATVLGALAVLGTGSVARVSLAAAAGFVCADGYLDALGNDITLSPIGYFVGGLGILWLEKSLALLGAAIGGTATQLLLQRRTARC